jgi:hypothetical protein
MNIESLVKSEPLTHGVMVAVRLPVDIVRKMQAVRKETKKSNTEVYTAFLRDGLEKYLVLSGKVDSQKKISTTDKKPGRVRKKKNTGNGTQPKGAVRNQKSAKRSK